MSDFMLAFPFGKPALRLPSAGNADSGKISCSHSFVMCLRNIAQATLGEIPQYRALAMRRWGAPLTERAWLGGEGEKVTLEGYATDPVWASCRAILPSPRGTASGRIGVRQLLTKGERSGGLKIDNVTTAKYDGKEVPVTGTGTAFDTVAYRQVDANTVITERSKNAPFGGEHENCSRKRAGLGKLADDVASMQGIASRQYWPFWPVNAAALLTGMPEKITK
jgi:hypothetical protein